MNTTTQVWLLFGAVSAISGILTVAIGWLIWKLRDNGRAWVFLVDQDAGAVKVLRKRPNAGKVVQKTPDGGREYALDGASRLQDGRRAYFFNDAVTGWPYRGFTAHERKEFLDGIHDAKERVRLMVQNPGLAWNMSQNTCRQRWIASKTEKEDWRVKIAPLAFIAVIFLAAALGFMAYKMNQGGA